MQAELRHVMQLTVQNPRAAARHLMGWQLPLSTVWLGMALMAVVSALLSTLSFLLAPAQSEPSMIEPSILAMLQNPLQVAVLQAVVMVIMAIVTTLMASPIFEWVYWRPQLAHAQEVRLEAI